MLGHLTRGRAFVAARTAASMRRCCTLEELSTSGGCAISAISRVALPCTSVATVISRGFPIASASPMWKRTSSCRYVRSRRSESSIASGARPSPSSAAGRARLQASTATPTSSAIRWSHISRQRSSTRRRRRRRRQFIDDERAAAASADRVQVAALPERDQRLAQRRARDPELRAQLALGRQARARRQQPEPDRGPDPVDRLLERGLRADRSKDRVQRRRRFECSTSDRSSCSSGCARRAHSRSKPRTRSQSVTAASKAASSTSAALR